MGPFTLSRPQRRYLISTYHSYRRMPRQLGRSFDEQAARFIAERAVTGVETEVDDELRLLVAASAVTLSAGWSGYRWPLISEVLLYPAEFDRDFVVGSPELSGLAHPWGTIVISVPALRHSFEHGQDGYHVGLHEFAHLLQDKASPYGVPRDLRTDEVRAWDLIQAREVEAARLGDSALDLGPLPLPERILRPGSRGMVWHLATRTGLPFAAYTRLR
jgi:MtfA peptidase